MKSLGRDTARQAQAGDPRHSPPQCLSMGWEQLWASYMVMTKRRLAARTHSNSKKAVEGAAPQFWVTQGSIGKGWLHSAAA